MRHLATFIVFLVVFSQTHLYAQQFTHQDTLRGSITKERQWWDLQHYSLAVKVNADKKFIQGSNTIKYKVLEPNQVMQIDLQDPLRITKITQNGENLNFEKDGYAYFITLSLPQKKAQIETITIFYEGTPKEAIRPPWDGGFTWAKDPNGKHFIATSNQGIGASIWWPCKDHMYDEPDEGIDMMITAPKGLMDVSNGQLIKTTAHKDGTKTFHWQVVNPINNYGVNINIGDYAEFGEIYKGALGDLKCTYYPLAVNLQKAKEQFKQVPKMLEAFEHWFGPYPFYRDGFKLVEVPYLGMEHQSSVTYGNQYMNGYRGRDLSDTGWGLKFDFIIIHEAGHEWFANSITNKDAADMWIHEGFTAYSESLYLDYHFGKQAGNEYTIGKRATIRNDRPIIGHYNVNHSGSGDMYNKGANMIHTYRQIINNDDQFRKILRGMNKEFYHQTVTTAQIENYMSEGAGLDLSKFFDQYLRTVKIPVLEYKINDKTIKYRFNNVVKGFEIPVMVLVNNKPKRLIVNEQWQEFGTQKTLPTLVVDQNYYINSKKL